MNPANLKYSKTHEWVMDMGGGAAKVGITDHAQDTLGDITFVELPKVGATLKMEGEAGVIESVKAASDLMSPVSGEVTAVNGALTSAPDAINGSPYESGWLYELKLANAAELDKLMDADAYEKYISEQKAD